MKIHARSLGIAASIAFCTLYTLLAVALKFFPNQALKYIGMIHMMPKLEYIKPFIDVTPKAVAIGFATHTIAVFLIFWLIATIYNLFQK